MSDLTVQKGEAKLSPKQPAPSVTPQPEDKPAPDHHIPRVAIIGVHGVANHAPGATANAMADLLLSLPAVDHDAVRYFPSFNLVGIQVPLQRLAVYAPTETGKPRTSFGRAFRFIQEESANFARLTRGYARKVADGPIRGFAGHEFMRQLLYRYEGGADGDTYVTTRLEGTRDANAPGGAAKVHIYEVLWADLARPANGILSFLLALFQLIFHLGSLSRLAIDAGAAWNNSSLWVAYRRTQRYAVRMLTVPIPLLKLLLLIALYSYIPGVLQPIKDQLWLPILLGAGAGIMTFFLRIRMRPELAPSDRFMWAASPAIAALFGAALFGAVAFRRPQLCAPTAVVELWLAGALLLWYVFDKYGEIRRGVGNVGWSLYGFFLLVFLVYLLRGFSVEQATFWVAQWIIVLLRLSWIALIAFAFVALMLGSLAWRSVQNPEQRGQARAAVRTSRFALAIPSLMFLLVTGLIWASLFALSRKIHDPYLEDPSLKAEEMMQKHGAYWLPEALLYKSDPDKPEKAEKACAAGPGCTKARIEYENGPYSADIKFFHPAEKPEKEELCSAGPNCTKGRIDYENIPHSTSIKFFDAGKHDYLQGVLAWSVTPGFPVLLGLATAGFLLLVWWALPSVLTEKFPLRNEQAPPRSSTNAESSWLGNWISRGLDSTSYVVFLTWCAIFVAPLYFLYPTSFQNTLTTVTASLVGYFIAGTIAAGLLAAIVKYSGSVLRIVLDVDTYLRTEPVEATPRAKIAERYVSLLRYLVCYRDPRDGRGYDSVVIVAHSLGTLISADLLRFLHQEGDPALAPLGLAGADVSNQGGVSLKLLTMGSPIRQLLNRFFPYLYDWAQPCPDNGLLPLPVPALSPPNIAPNALPDPAELGVTQWVNMYRSGDYVGRSLWLTEWYRRTTGDDNQGRYPQALYVASSAGRAEMCIGAGAHTHYWDDTAPDVAEQLNGLI